jgi:RNA polymerase sigma-70 factor (ECF subfamily)
LADAAYLIVKHNQSENCTGGILKSDNSIRKQNKTLIQETPLLSPRTFEKFYQKNYLAVYRYVFALTAGSRQQAEDLTAETFLRAWKKRNTFHGKLDSALAWIIRIARNQVIDAHRREKTRPDSRAGMLDEEQDRVTLPASNPESALLLNERQQALLILLNELPPNQREMLVLHYLLNWRIKRVAQYLDIPANTVSVYIRRALKKLRLLWLDQEEDSNEK